VKLFLIIALCATFVCAQQTRPPLVRSWTIREVGGFKKIPTAALRQQMTQRGVLFGVDEPYDQNKVDGTMLLLKQLYKNQGIDVTVRFSKTPSGTNSVKVEYVVNKVVNTGR
jgi:hypothetical protein